MVRRGDREGLRELVLFSCEEPADAARQKWVQAVRQSVSNQAALSLADNERLMKLGAALHGGETRYRPPQNPAEDPGCTALPVLKEGTLAQKVTRVAERVGIGCGDWNTRLHRDALPLRFGEDRRPWWLVDFNDGLGSELAKGAFVGAVLTNFKSLSKAAQEDLRYYLPWIHASAVELDAARFRTQLDALPVPEASKGAALLFFGGARARFERQRAFVTAQAKANKGVEGMFLSGPTAARAQWAKDAQAHPGVLEQLLALEEKMTDTPGGMTGCAKALFPLFQEWVKKTAKPAASVTAQEFVMRDYVGSQLAYGLTLCGLNDADAPVLDQVFGYYLSRVEAQRGPMVASHLGSIDGWNAAQAKRANAELPDPSGALVTPPTFGMSMHSSFLPFDGQSVRSGVVASVKPQKDKVRITFKKEPRKEPILKCGFSDKLLSVTTNGTRIFEYHCKKVGERPVTDSHAPITVPVYAAGGIKAGSLVLFWDYDDGKEPAWPIEVFSDKSRKKRVNLLGAQL